MDDGEDGVVVLGDVFLPLVNPTLRTVLTATVIGTEGFAGVSSLLGEVSTDTTWAGFLKGVWKGGRFACDGASERRILAPP